MTSPFAISETSIPGLLFVKRKKYGDFRGEFDKIFCATSFSSSTHGAVEQINLSRTTNAGTIRGMHAQDSDPAEYKIVTCIRGTVFDVAVDLRTNSETYGRCVCFELCGASNMTVVFPPGVAHGFQTLVDDCELVYAHTARYSAENEYGVNPLDPDLNIPWPILTDIAKISDRDKSLPLFSEITKNAL